VRLGEIGRRHCLRIQDLLEQSSGSHRPKLPQELSKFGTRERKVTILWVQFRFVELISGALRPAMATDNNNM